MDPVAIPKNRVASRLHLCVPWLASRRSKTSVRGNGRGSFV